MNELILGGAISIICSILTLVGVIYTAKKSHEQTVSEVQKQVELLNQRFELVTAEIKKDIKDLDEGVHKYNNLKDRMFGVEASINLIDERQKMAITRIDNLEKRG